MIAIVASRVSQASSCKVSVNGVFMIWHPGKLIVLLNQSLAPKKGSIGGIVMEKF